jgi:malate synthase
MENVFQYQNPQEQNQQKNPTTQTDFKPFLDRISVRSPHKKQQEFILSPECLRFVVDLHDRFEFERINLLALRRARTSLLRRGEPLTRLRETQYIRNGEWKIQPLPRDLQKRNVEITGPAEPKMIINALNSGADVFMADFEDSLSPTWENIMAGQCALYFAVRRCLRIKNEENDKTYTLNENLATLKVRPRGLHLIEEHVHIDERPISASFFDFGVYFFHNAKELIERGTGPYFYLPKLENHLEARMWNSIFEFAQDYLQIPRGTIKATVLIETIPAAFEMEEILYELKEHSAGLNAGRWDYLFSIIKKFSYDSAMILPYRAELTMTTPFMKAYSELIVATCHKRGAPAIGGMSAFIPNRRDAKVTEQAIEKVRADKSREVNQGFDGTWVAHPDLIAIARQEFDEILKGKTNQIEYCPKADDSHWAKLIPSYSTTSVPIEGVRTNIKVCLEYLSAWFSGSGAVAIDNLMEDAATAEISRSQLWQWLNHGIEIENHGPFTPMMYRELADKIQSELTSLSPSQLSETRSFLDELVFSENLDEFLTLKAYNRIVTEEKKCNQYKQLMI